jgi:hypothetical protein
MKRALAIAGVVLIAAACDHRDRFAAPDTSSIPATPTIPERSAYLSISDPSPRAGAVVVVAGTLRVSDKLSLGSFRVRLAFDSTRLHFVEDVTAADIFRVVNPRPGDVIVVGATPNASTDGRLFALRLRVDDPAGVSSLLLRIDELNDAEYKNQKETVTRASTLIVDRSLEKLVPR